MEAFVELRDALRDGDVLRSVADHVVEVVDVAKAVELETEVGGSTAGKPARGTVGNLAMSAVLSTQMQVLWETPDFLSASELSPLVFLIQGGTSTLSSDLSVRASSCTESCIPILKPREAISHATLS